METLTVPPAETQSSSIWLIIGVVVPVLLALFIIVILYWKLCGSEKLEFQPDAINTIQQRQKVRGQQEVVWCPMWPELKADHVSSLSFRLRASKALTLRSCTWVSTAKTTSW